MPIILLTCLLITSFLSQAQNDELFKLWPDSTLVKANAGKNLDYLSEEEKQAIYYTNLVRINPPLFAETILKEYLKENDIKKDKDIKSLFKELDDTQRMGILKPSEKLTKLARSHAIDMGESGRTGHNSSNGKGFRDRLEPLEKHFDAINENCNYGNQSGKDAVIDLLIDRKVPNAGHRHNILDSEMTHIGVAIEPHKRWHYNMVQDFGARK